MKKHFLALGMTLAFGVLQTGASHAAWNEGDQLQEEAIRLTADITRGKELYNMVCSGCHAATAWGTEDGVFPEIAGQHHNVLIKQLADIRALNRDNPVMYPFTLSSIIGGAQEVADVTAYVASMPVSRNNGVGPGKTLERGEQLYNSGCATCHGVRGEGNGEAFYPRIQGQHYAYLQRQIEWFLNGKRRNANPEMMAQIKGMSAEDIAAVSDYISRLKP